MIKKKALIVIDLQRDFCPGGSLAVPDGDKIVPVVNDLLERFDLVIFTQDWHDPEMDAFASQHPGASVYDSYVRENGEKDILWPDHCVADTLGASFHPDLNLSKCKKDFYIFKKGMERNNHVYSAFDRSKIINPDAPKKLQDFLNERNVVEVYVCGLALDYCVKETAIDAAMEGFNTYVIEDACKSINSDLSETIEAFTQAKVYYVDSLTLSFIGNI